MILQFSIAGGGSRYTRRNILMSCNAMPVPRGTVIKLHPKPFIRCI